MNAPIRMTCAKCGKSIEKGTPIVRAPGRGTSYAHANCGNPGGKPDPKGVPAPVPRKGEPKETIPKAEVPKGWVTEDRFATVDDAVKKLRSQTEPRDRSDEERGTDTRHDWEEDAERNKDDDVPDLFSDLLGEDEGSNDDGRDGGNGGPGDGSGDDHGGGQGSDRKGEQKGEQGDGEEEGGDEEGEGDESGDGEQDGDESEDGDEQGDGEEEGGGEDGEGEGQKEQDRDGGEKPKPKPKERSATLDDLPDELLTKLVLLTAEMVHTKIKGGIEPKLARLMAEAAEPLVGRMAAEFQNRMGGTVQDQLKRAVKEATEKTGNVVAELRREIDKRVEAEIKRLDGVRVVVHKVERPGEPDVLFKDGELFHYAFEEVFKLTGAGFDVFMPGPTGCGKTHLAEQVARGLGVGFGIVSGTGGVTETELFGNATPNITTGETVYQPTEFVTLYENGGVFLLDEADAMDANCLLKVNAAIANGYCTIPKRLGKPRAVRHPEFRFLMAANTWGNGATRLYCGRNKLDEATLDRFRAATVPMDYDKDIERKLVGDQELYRTLAQWRANIVTHGLQRVLSTRFMIHARKLKGIGYTVAQIGEKLTGGWTPGEVAKVLSA